MTTHSEQHLWGMINHMPDATWIIDNKGVVIAWNRACEELTGTRAEEMIGRGNYEYALPFYGERRPLLIDVALVPNTEQEHGYVSFERRGDMVAAEIFVPHFRPGGVYIWGTARRLYDEQGQVIGAIETVRDITEQKRAARHQRAQTAILELIATRAPLQGILDVIARTVEQECVGALCSVLLVNDRGDRLLHGAAPSLPDAYNRAVSGLRIGFGMGSCGTAAATRQRIIVEDIRTHPFWRGFRPATDAGLIACWSEPILSSSGSVLGTFAIYYAEQRSPKPVEIAILESSAYMASIAIEQDRNKGALEASEGKYRSLFESAHDGILIMSQSIIRDCNTRMAQMLGAPRLQIIGRSLFDFSPDKQGGQDTRELGASLIEAALGGCPQFFDWRQCRPDGTVFDAEVSLSRLEISSEPHLQAIVRDVTERRQLQEVMLQTEKMLLANSMAAGLAHEINNPLGVILQNVQNVRRRLSNRLAANGKAAQEVGLSLEALQTYLHQRGIFDLLELITRAGARAAEIIAQLQAFVQRGATRLEPVTVADLVDKALERAACDHDLKKQCHFSGIAIVRRYDPHLSTVMLNRTEIEHALLNVITNAVQALAAVEQDPRLIISVTGDGTFVRIVVEDNGPGIPPQASRRILDPFFTTREVGSGTGLGLSLAHALVVNNHGGNLEVGSSPGGGTRVTIRLPQRPRGTDQSAFAGAAPVAADESQTSSGEIMT